MADATTWSRGRESATAAVPGWCVGHVGSKKADDDDEADLLTHRSLKCSTKAKASSGFHIGLLLRAVD